MARLLKRERAHFAIVDCGVCNGTGHMSNERAAYLNAQSRRPVCLCYGCEACDGTGEVIVEVEDNER